MRWGWLMFWRRNGSRVSPELEQARKAYSRAEADQATVDALQLQHRQIRRRNGLAEDVARALGLE